MKTMIAVLMVLAMVACSREAQAVDVPPGATVELNVQGTQDVEEWTWWHNGVLCEDEVTSTIHLFMVGPQHEGPWLVRMRNPEGDVFSSLTLRVIGVPKVLIPLTAYVVDPVLGMTGHNVYVSMSPLGPYAKVNDALIPPGEGVTLSWLDMTTQHIITRGVDTDGVETPVDSNIIFTE